MLRNGALGNIPPVEQCKMFTLLFFYFIMTAMLNNAHSRLAEQSKNVHGPSLDKKYFSWSLDLQHPYQEADVFGLLNSRPFNQFRKNIENMAKVRTTGHLSITYNLDILRNTLWQAVRRNRGRMGVSSVLMMILYFVCENSSCFI